MGKTPHSTRQKLATLRNRTTHYPLPTTVQELSTLVHTTNKKCPCDTCNPTRSKTLNCLLRPHFKIPLHKNLTTNRFGNTVFAPPKLTSRTAWPPEGTHLVRTIITYFDQPRDRLNDEQLRARTVFNEWRTRHWKDITRTYATPDGAMLLPAHEMHLLWTCISVVFFGGAIARSKFHWTTSLPPDTLGRAKPGIPFLKGPRILMNPRRTARDFGDYVALDFISTLVHESIHVFLQQYPCWMCRSWVRDYVGGGHGWAFQVIGKKVEEVFPRLLGLPVKLGRFEAFVGDCGVGWVPSVHEFGVFAFEDVEREVRNEEVRELVERTAGKYVVV